MTRFKSASKKDETLNEVVTFGDLNQLNKEKLAFCNKSDCRLQNYLSTAYKKYPIIRLIKLDRATGTYKC